MSIKDLVEQDEQDRRDRAELDRLRALEHAGKYSRPPFTEPKPRRCDRCGRAWMSFWLMVVWILALLASIIWGPNP